MAKLPDVYVGKRLFVGEGKPEILGRGPTEVRGSAYIEGPQITGSNNNFIVLDSLDKDTLSCTNLSQRDSYRFFINKVSPNLRKMNCVLIL